jgi:uroporphyrin-III C-methyltransferase/precorrin-2 dehydrogenase/sirohydrochlorin ferrochelatase
MLGLKRRRCLIVGGGAVALRKVVALIDEGAEVTVVAPEVVERLEALAREGRIRLELRTYRPGEAAGHALVFATTDERETNRQVAEDAEAAGVWVNVADDPALCGFHVPSRIRRGPLEIAVASGGAAPFATRRLRQVLERRLTAEWGDWMQAAARFRSTVRGLDLDPGERERRFDQFFAATVDETRLAARTPRVGELDSWLGRPVPSAPDQVGTPDADRPLAPERPVRAFVSLVGAGPGCPGLLTLRGRQRLLSADAVAYDRLAAPALPCDLPAGIQLHCVGKEAGHHPVPQGEINELLIRLAREGKRVVRLKGGDPFVFGRGGEEAEALAAAGIPFEVVPGVTSGIAAPGWIGVPVTHRHESVRLTLLTAHESSRPDAPGIRWDLLAQDPHATLVGYMGVTATPNVVSHLLAAGMAPETPAAMVERGTTAGQRSVVTTLADLPEAVRRGGIEPPALFVIGPTVARASVLDWVSRLPLAGERIVLCGPRHDTVAESLEAAGAEVLPVALPLSPAARVVVHALPLTGCIVFRRHDLERLDAERSGPGWDRGPVAWCVGAEAAQAARERGWRRVEVLGDEASDDEIVGRIQASERRKGTS